MEPSDARAVASDPRIGSIAGKRFELLRLIGEGGMGRVYEAIDTTTGGRVAIKTITALRLGDAGALARFEREAKTTASLVHPNIVEVFDVGTLEDGAPFIAMELLEGESLGQRLAREHRLPIRRAITIALAVCEGLRAAHDKGIIHRDLTPENIYLLSNASSNVAAKILDFGISKPSDDPESRTLTSTGATMGTPRYMAPEQIEGLEVDPRTDVYSLGVVLYRALVGVEPFVGNTPHLLAYRILAEEPTPPRRRRPDVPESLERVVLRALAKRPDDRFESAMAFAEAIAPFARHTEASTSSHEASVRVVLDAARAKGGARAPRARSHGSAQREPIALGAVFLVSFFVGFGAARDRSSVARPHEVRAHAIVASAAPRSSEPKVPGDEEQCVAPLASSSESSSIHASSVVPIVRRSSIASRRRDDSANMTDRRAPPEEDGFVDEF